MKQKLALVLSVELFLTSPHWTMIDVLSENGLHDTALHNLFLILKPSYLSFPVSSQYTSREQNDSEVKNNLRFNKLFPIQRDVIVFEDFFLTM